MSTESHTPDSATGRDHVVDFLTGQGSATPRSLEEAEQIADRFIAGVRADALVSAGLDIFETGFDDATGVSNWLDDRADRIRHDARCDHPKCPGGSLCCCHQGRH